MTTRKPALTIFQKMLVAPLAAVLLYSVYLLFIFEEQKVSQQAIEAIRASHLPVIKLAGNNVLLFDAIAGSLKDAVLAGEAEWVENTRTKQAQIEANLAALAQHASAVNGAEVERLRQLFRRYYDNAYSLSLAMLQHNADSEEMNRLIENVEQYHSQVSHDFEVLQNTLQQQFSRHIDETNHRLQRQLLYAAALGVALIVVIIGVTFVTSLSTRRSLHAVTLALKNIAQDTPDFSRRLRQESQDELGQIVGWFNLLADKLEKDYKLIELASITDKLTQLYNRTKLDELFEFEINKARRYPADLTAILIDLDHFKSVNDTYGHQIGDIVLRETASILTANVRDTDHIGRWGGEEFIILAPCTNLEQGRELAEKLRAAIAAFDFTMVGSRTGSFGVAVFHEGDSEDSLTRRADECLYLAKEQGRNRVVDESAL